MSKNRPLRSIAVSFSLLSVACLAACGEESDSETTLTGPVTVLTGARLIDGNGGSPIENATIVIQGDRIRSVGATGSVELPDDVDETIDLTGKTIMPGIISVHGHLAQTKGNLVNSVDNYTEENVRQKLDLYARYGVLHLTSLGRRPIRRVQCG